MSYTKTTWNDGDIITANKMNNIETGVESLNTDVGQLQTDLNSLTETVENLPTGGGDVPADYQQLVDDVTDLKADLNEKTPPKLTVTDAKSTFIRTVNEAFTITENSDKSCTVGIISGTGKASTQKFASRPIGTAKAHFIWELGFISPGIIRNAGGTATKGILISPISGKVFSYIIGTANSTQIGDYLFNGFSGGECEISFTSNIYTFHIMNTDSTYTVDINEIVQDILTEGETFEGRSELYISGVIKNEAYAGKPMLTILNDSKCYDSQGNLIPGQMVYADIDAEEDLPLLSNGTGGIKYGSKPDKTQWDGKIWYAYGTSLTNINQEGKYATYLANMSGMHLFCKGISGGGIGNIGGHSTGQVYEAICNTTDGKTVADLITLETGANDVADAVPLGTIFDTGRSTLAGCLNDCIHYLQENTTAQIAIIPSPCGKLTPDKSFQWVEMIRQICDINRVTYLSPNDNIGKARANSSQGSSYLVDNIHQTELGGYVLAEYLWYQLRNIPLFHTTMPI